MDLLIRIRLRTHENIETKDINEAFLVSSNPDVPSQLEEGERYESETGTALLQPTSDMERTELTEFSHQQPNPLFTPGNLQQDGNNTVQNRNPLHRITSQNIGSNRSIEPSIAKTIAALRIESNHYPNSNNNIGIGETTRILKLARDEKLSSTSILNHSDSLLSNSSSDVPSPDEG